MDTSPASNQQDDPIFAEEQAHLTKTHAKLEQMGLDLLQVLKKTQDEAAQDKKDMADEIAPNLATYADAMETYADIAAMNRVVDGYNRAQDAATEKLNAIQLLVQQPYFAKVALQFKPGTPAKELYIGNAGIADEGYHRLVVDWRSPVAEMYYNQANGPTSYKADGRTITCDLKLRRQFDLAGNVLNAYFDTTVAIQDQLLLASLSKQRTAHMQAITATIQKEQNQVVRHGDVPTLLVNGIAGSGKTSVLMQRIAYLFYQNRQTLDPSQVFLISPNPVFSRYIDGVLPDLGEANPETLTWDEFARTLLPANSGSGSADVPFDLLERIDQATASFAFDQNDFRDIRVADTRLIGADQIRKLATKFGHIPAGPHLVTLIREELLVRLESRLKQMAGDERVWDEVAALDVDEQLRLFHETITPQDEAEERAYALTLLRDRYATAFGMVERDEWLRIDRIGKRLLEQDGLPPTAWLYLKMALTGLSNPDAKYVMVDEVQDYSLAQLAVLARYFRRAHFLLLGDPNQAIAPGTASYPQIRALFERENGPVETCSLMTSYRSTPQITQLFAQLMTQEERMQVSSIQREEDAPSLAAYDDDAAYEAALREAVRDACDGDGLTAIIAPYKQRARSLHALLGLSQVQLIDGNASLPASGVVVVPLKLAKGLEFDRVIIPDASAKAFPDEPLAKRRLYTTLSRATRSVTVLAHGTMTPLLAGKAKG